MESGGDTWLSGLLLIGAAGFGWNFVHGYRTGSARIPLSLFAEDKYSRGETMFGLAQSFNLLGCLVALGIVSKLLIGW